MGRLREPDAEQRDLLLCEKTWLALCASADADASAAQIEIASTAAVASGDVVRTRRWIVTIDVLVAA
jgi:hypothetical protein